MRGRDFQLCGFCFLFTYLWADSSIRLVYFSLLRCTFWVILHSFQSSDNLDASESNANVIKWDKHHESKDIIMDLRLRNIYIYLTAHTNGKWIETSFDKLFWILSKRFLHTWFEDIFGILCLFLALRVYICFKIFDFKSKILQNKHSSVNMKIGIRNFWN